MVALVQWADVNHLDITKARIEFRAKDEAQAQAHTAQVHVIRAGKRV